MILAWTNNKRYGEVLDKIKGCLFLGVPHRGADLAYWAEFPALSIQAASLGLKANPRFLNSLKTNSKTLMKIADEFVYRSENLEIRSFYETEKMGNTIVREICSVFSAL